MERGRREKERWRLMMGTKHIFSERSLHRQMAALCCSALLMFPIITGPDFHLPFPLFWESPIHLAPGNIPPSSPWHNINHTSVSEQTMRAALVLITSLSDERKKENQLPLPPHSPTCNMQWHEQVWGNDTNKLGGQGTCDRTGDRLVLHPAWHYSVVSALLYLTQTQSLDGC